MNDQKYKESKTQKKRSARLVYKLGAHLTKLSALDLTKLTLPTDILSAIEDCQKCNKRVAKRRYQSRLARLLREVDHELIKIKLSNLKAKNASN